MDIDSQGIMESCRELLTTLKRFIKRCVAGFYSKLPTALKKAIKAIIRGDTLQVTFKYRERSPGTVFDADKPEEFTLSEGERVDLSKEFGIDLNSEASSLSSPQSKEITFVGIKNLLKLWLHSFLSYLRFVKVILW
jgi:hypothetical protein